MRFKDKIEPLKAVFIVIIGMLLLQIFSGLADNYQAHQIKQGEQHE